MKGKITCKQAVDYISKKEEGKLSSWQRVQLWRHLTVCSLCRLFSAQNTFIIRAWSGYKKDEPNHLEEAEKNEIIRSVLNKNKLP